MAIISQLCVHLGLLPQEAFRELIANALVHRTAARISRAADCRSAVGGARGARGEPWGRRTRGDPEYRSRRSAVSAGNIGGTKSLYPADSGDARAVTSVGVGTHQIASYASHGAWVELDAAARDVIGPVPDGGYTRWSGTSMAAPMVSGQAALVESDAPKLTLDQTITVLTTSVTDIGSSHVRYGVVDVSRSVAKLG